MSDLISKKEVLKAIDELLISPFARDEYFGRIRREAIQGVRLLCVSNIPTIYDMEEKLKSETTQEVLQALTFTIVKGEEIPNDTITKNTILQVLSVVMQTMEKQTSKKPIPIINDGVIYPDLYKCPKCQRKFKGTREKNFATEIVEYCYHCGQKLDWSEEDGQTAEKGINSGNQI